jgi:hypothetical protein
MIVQGRVQDWLENKCTIKFHVIHVNMAVPSQAINPVQADSFGLFRTELTLFDACTFAKNCISLAILVRDNPIVTFDFDDTLACFHNSTTHGEPCRETVGLARHAIKTLGSQSVFIITARPDSTGQRAFVRSWLELNNIIGPAILMRPVAEINKGAWKQREREKLECSGNLIILNCGNMWWDVGDYEECTSTAPAREYPQCRNAFVCFTSPDCNVPMRLLVNCTKPNMDVKMDGEI